MQLFLEVMNICKFLKLMISATWLAAKLKVFYGFSWSSLAKMKYPSDRKTLTLIIGKTQQWLNVFHYRNVDQKTQNLCFETITLSVTNRQSCNKTLKIGTIQVVWNLQNLQLINSVRFFIFWHSFDKQKDFLLQPVEHFHILFPRTSFDWVEMFVSNAKSKSDLILFLSTLIWLTLITWSSICVWFRLKMSLSCYGFIEHNVASKWLIMILVQFREQKLLF